MKDAAFRLGDEVFIPDGMHYHRFQVMTVIFPKWYQKYYRYLVSDDRNSSTARLVAENKIYIKELSHAGINTKEAK